MSATMIAWLRQLSVRNHLQWLKILLTFVGPADGSFHFEWFPL